MSTTDSPAPIEKPDVSSLPATVLHPHKSYRRKYRKIMVKFEKEMRESSHLFKNQQRMYDITQRIAEQNDQLLDLLLELNTQPQVPARLRYDLSEPSAFKQPEKHEDEQKAIEGLRITRHRVSKGDLEQSDYGELVGSLLDNVEYAPKRSYADLLKTSTLRRAQAEDEELASPLAGGFLSTKLEDQYLQSLEDYLDEKSANPRQHASGNIGHSTSDKSVDKEREFQLRNPVSVYNWLRKNNPTVFLQDPDSEKTKAASRSSKRASTTKGAIKPDPDLYDNEGVAVESNTAKGKRKRDDDGGYRPKGGHARPAKKRKEDSGRRSKRASMDITG